MKISGPITSLFIVLGVFQMSCSSSSISIKGLWRNRRVDKRFIPTIFKKLITRRFPTWLTAAKRRNIVSLNEQVDPSQFWLAGTVPARRKSTSAMNSVYRDPYALPIDSSQRSGLTDSYEEIEPDNWGRGVDVFMEIDMRPSLLNYFEDQRIKRPKIKSNHLQQVSHSQTDWFRKFPCQKLEDQFECYNSNQFYHPVGLAVSESNVPFQNNLVGYYDNTPFSYPSEERRTFEISADLGKRNKGASSMYNSSKR